MKVREKRFLDSLESLFTGAEVDGESGFVNLMRMKHQYFQSVKPTLIKAIDARIDGNEEFREELFDKLYTFLVGTFVKVGPSIFVTLPHSQKRMSVCMQMAMTRRWFGKPECSTM